MGSSLCADGARRRRGRTETAEEACSPASSPNRTAARLERWSDHGARIGAARVWLSAAGAIRGLPVVPWRSRSRRLRLVDVSKQGRCVTELEATRGPESARRRGAATTATTIAARLERGGDGAAHVARPGDVCSHRLVPWLGGPPSAPSNKKTAAPVWCLRPSEPAQRPRVGRPERSLLGPCLPAGPPRLLLQDEMGVHRRRSLTGSGAVKTVPARRPPESRRPAGRRCRR
jgi:hypothetical protein